MYSKEPKLLILDPLKIYEIDDENDMHGEGQAINDIFVIPNISAVKNFFMNFKYLESVKQKENNNLPEELSEIIFEFAIGKIPDKDISLVLKEVMEEAVERLVHNERLEFFNITNAANIYFPVPSQNDSGIDNVNQSGNILSSSNSIRSQKPDPKGKGKGDDSWKER